MPVAAIEIQVLYHTALLKCGVQYLYFPKLIVRFGTIARNTQKNLICEETTHLKNSHGWMCYGGHLCCAVCGAHCVRCRSTVPYDTLQYLSYGDAFPPFRPSFRCAELLFLRSRHEPSTEKLRRGSYLRSLTIVRISARRSQPAFWVHVAKCVRSFRRRTFCRGDISYRNISSRRQFVARLRRCAPPGLESMAT